MQNHFCFSNLSTQILKDFFKAYEDNSDFSRQITM